MLFAPPGMGKSEAAISFLNANRDKFSLVWTINCRNPSTVKESYEILAGQLKLQQVPGEGVERLIKRVHAHLETAPFAEPWCLFFDNADCKTALPKGGHGRLLITSTNQALWKLEEILPVRAFSEQEAVSLFKKVLGDVPSEEVEKLALKLDYHPLAVDQAARYIAEIPGMTVAKFLNRLESYPLELLSQGNDRYSKSVRICLELPLAQLKQSHPEAFEWLSLSACLSGDWVPISWLEAWGKAKFSGVQADLEIDQIKKSLVDLGLVRIDDRTQSMSLHQLRQVVLKEKRTEETLANAFFALEKIPAALPFTTLLHRKWEEDLLFERSALFLLKEMEKRKELASYTATLYGALGQLTMQHGRFGESRVYLEKSLDEWNQMPTGEFLYGTLSTTLRYINLQYDYALVLGLLGETNRAKEAFEKLDILDRKFHDLDATRRDKTILRVALTDFEGIWFFLPGLQKRFGNWSPLKWYEADNEITYERRIWLFRVVVQRKHKEACEIVLHSLQTENGNFVEDHPVLADGLLAWGKTLVEEENRQEAKQKLHEAFQMNRRLFGEHHQATVQSKQALEALDKQSKGCAII